MKTDRLRRSESWSAGARWALTAVFGFLPIVIAGFALTAAYMCAFHDEPRGDTPTHWTNQVNFRLIAIPASIVGVVTLGLGLTVLWACPAFDRFRRRGRQTGAPVEIDELPVSQAASPVGPLNASEPFAGSLLEQGIVHAETLRDASQSQLWSMSRERWPRAIMKLAGSLLWTGIFLPILVVVIDTTRYDSSAWIGVVLVTVIVLTTAVPFWRSAIMTTREACCRLPVFLLDAAAVVPGDSIRIKWKCGQRGSPATHLTIDLVGTERSMRLLELPHEYKTSVFYRERMIDRSDPGDIQSGDGVVEVPSGVIHSLGAGLPAFHELVWELVVQVTFGTGLTVQGRTTIVVLPEGWELPDNDEQSTA